MLGMGLGLASESASGASGVPRDLQAGDYAILQPHWTMPNVFSGTAASGNHVQHFKVRLFFPPWMDGTTPVCIMFPNWINTASTAPERPNAFPITINYCEVIKNDASNVDVLFGGQVPGTVPAGGWLWSDPFTPGGGGFTSCILNIEIQVNVGEHYPTGMMLNLVNDLGEGRESLAVSDPSKRFNGNITVGNSNSESYAPALAAFGNYDGTTRILHIWGDSEPWGQNDPGYLLASLGTIGAEARGLNDTTHGQVWTANFSHPGAAILSLASQSGNNADRRWACQGIFPNKTYHDFCTNLGINDIIIGAGTETLADMQSKVATLYGFWRTKLSIHGRIYHSLGRPLTTSTDNFLSLTNQTETAGAEPSGVWWQYEAWLAGGTAGNDGTVNMNAYMGDSVVTTKWKVPTGAWTLHTALSSTGQRTAVLDGPSPPSIGTNLVFDPGTGSVESLLMGAVTATAGTTYTCFLPISTGQTHLVNSAISEGASRDGTHSPTPDNVAAIAAWAAAKLAGTIVTVAP